MGLFDKFKDAVAEVTGQNDAKPGDQVVMINNDDEAMNDAVEQARATLPDFLAFYKNPPVNALNCRVKAYFMDGANREAIWLTDIVQEGNAIRGTVGNVPELVGTVHAGQEVLVPMQDICDWAFEAGGKQYGSYTVYAMFRTMPASEVDMYVQGYGFTQNPLETPGAGFAQLTANLPEPGEEEEEAGGEALPGLMEKLEAELQSRLAGLFEGETPDERERVNAANSFASQILAELEGSPYEAGARQLQHKYEQAFLKHLGQSDGDRAAAVVGEDEAIMGVTLADYAAASAKLSTVPLEKVLAALGVSAEEYNSISEQWAARMDADTSFQVAMQYGEYFAAADSHPKLGSL